MQWGVFYNEILVDTSLSVNDSITNDSILLFGAHSTIRPIRGRKIE